MVTVKTFVQRLKRLKINLNEVQSIIIIFNYKLDIK